MRAVVHFINPSRAMGRSEQLRQAVRVAHASGLRVGITFGNGVFTIPPGYGLEYAAGGRLALRTPEGALVVYKPLRPRPERPATTYVRASRNWMGD